MDNTKKNGRVVVNVLVYGQEGAKLRSLLAQGQRAVRTGGWFTVNDVWRDGGWRTEVIICFGDER